ncbi:MAG: right-handed parallel beta-helix repeat-containing protein, partial [Planctomycetota bacterium]
VKSGEQEPGEPNSFLRYIETISAGRSGRHSLAVDANNFVWAWGYNEYGQLSNSQSGSGERELTPVQVHGGEMETTFLENIIAVSAGEEHSMAADSNGFVWTWGDNKWEDPNIGYGKLGNGSEVDFNDTPVQVLSGQQDNSTSGYLENIVAVSTGWDHCMALEEYEAYDPLKDFLDPNYTGPDPNYQGRVYTWGRNTKSIYGDYGGRLGDGTYEDSNTPVIVLSGEQDPNDQNSFLEDIFAISAGESHSLALDVNGFVYAWGDNQWGQLGNGNNDPCTTPVRVVGFNGEGYLENIIAISAGFWHSLAIDVNGTVWSWGYGYSGRLGLGDQSGLGDAANKNTPHPIPVVYNNTQHTFYFKIQDAIDNANDYDVIEASLGTYYENIHFLGKSITVKSTDPNNWYVVANTIIDASYNYSYVADFNDNSGSTLAGFTLTNGYYGGIYCDNSNPNITNCLITQNRNQNTPGGGIYCTNYASPTITNCNFSGNLASYGGGIHNDYSDPNITNCTFTNNSAYRGGAVDNNSSDPNITNCIFSANTATVSGGGIYHRKDSSPTVKNCVFSGNSAASVGGGMVNSYESLPTITNCTFSNNSANEGGAVYNFSSSDPNITNCVFSGNSAAFYGGGMVNSYESSPTITNCIFWGNSATTVWDSNGGAICNWIDSDPNVTNCTFSNNSANNGGGAYNHFSSPNITNCIFWDNFADSNGNEIYNSDTNSVPNFSYCDIEDSNGSGVNWYGKLGTDGGGNIDEDPCFMDVNTPTGSWTADASYDSSTYQSTLTDANASWSVNELAARFINPNTSQNLQFLIVSNDTNTIT